MIEPFTALTAFAPLVIEAGRALVNRFLGTETFRPTNIDDWVRMQEVEVRRFEALTAAGAGAPSYPWVEAIVRLQRPAIGLLVLLIWATVHVHRATIAPDIDTSAVDTAAGAVWFYLFGERTLAHLRPPKPGHR